MFIAFAKRRFVHSTSTSLAHMVEMIVRGTWSPFFFFFALNTHNLVDDYSGTLGGVCKVHISALVTSPKNLVVALSFSLCLSKNKTNKKWVDCSVGGTWHKSVNSRCLYRLSGEWVPVATKIMNLLKKSQPPCLKLLEAKRGEGQQAVVPSC